MEALEVQLPERIRCMNILVSACLLGVNCRYSGTGASHEEIIALKHKHNLIPICPEQLGGLPTPRNPVEIINGKAKDKQGKDFTKEFTGGAMETLQLAKTLDCKLAILKSNSPSCGNKNVYDGTFEGKLIDGQGFTAKILMDQGIEVISEKELHKYII